MSISANMLNSAADNLTTTLIDEGSFDASTVVAAGTTIPSPQNTVITRTVSIPMPTAKVDGLYRIMITGTGGSADNSWKLYNGWLNYNVSTLGNNGYDMWVTSTSNGSNIVFTFTFRNLLLAATKTLPQITLNVHARLFAYPWAT